MIDQDEARARAAAIVTAFEDDSGLELVLSQPADHGWCWVFTYQNRAYVETGSISHALAGNGPIAIDKRTGEVHQLGTAQPVDEELRRVREHLN